ncbi:MAG: DNA cytosine methyltransferase [Mycoplasmataceae bacterium]|nr:DNA cytosine methyltransferase [Mycoplasmataceae bacterium]
MKEIRLFEAFAGIGSQYTALNNIKNKLNINVESRIISEWDIYSIHSYILLNGYNPIYKIERGREEEFWKWVDENDFSRNGKDINFLKWRSDEVEILKSIFNFNKNNKILTNIFKVKGSDVIEEKINFLTYSFPCQDLSTAGKGLGFKKGGNTRSGLLWEIERILEEVDILDKEKLPKMLVMENVSNLFSKKYKSEYIEWKKILKSKGYTTYDGILDARDFGIPQSRRRAFAVSILNSKINFEEGFDLNKILFNSKNKTNPLGFYLRYKYENEKYLKESLSASPRKTFSRERMFNTSEKILLTYNNKNETSFIKSCRTITTRQDRWNNAGMLHFNIGKIFNGNFEKIPKNISNEKVENIEYRFITPRESMLLMGYKERNIEKIISNKHYNKFKLWHQAGNSIVIPVLENIFKEFLKKI